MHNSKFSQGLALCFAFAILLTACGKAGSPVTSAEEEICSEEACNEQSLNEPVGPQPEQEPEVAYDMVASNPARATLRFPAFSSSWGLKRATYDKAARYFNANKNSIANPRYFMVVDFSKHSSARRFFLFDLSNGKVERNNVAAGKNSDPDVNGYATLFSNVEGSKKSSLGFYRTGTTYNGKHGLSLHLHGLSSTNSNAYSRAIVIHSADYVKNGVKAGLSWGCPALDPAVSANVIGRVKNGAMLLIDR